MSSPNSPAAPDETPFAPLTSPAGSASADPETSPSPLVTNAETELPTVPVAELRDVTKVYGEKGTRVEALRGVNVDINAREFTVIMGPSGSGKSTLLHVLAGLDAVTSGSITVNRMDITKLKDKPLTLWRRDNVGFVFQSFNLVPTLSAGANIELPLRLANKPIDRHWFDQIVTGLDLTTRLNHKPYELSGGQVQRVAVARALLSRPAMLVADEPTGNLDTASSAEVLNLLRAAVDNFGQTVVMVTHDQHAATTGDRVLIVRDGMIVHDLHHPEPADIAKVA